MNAIIQLFPSNPPRNPAASSRILLSRAIITYAVWTWGYMQAERFRRQQKIEIAAAAAHKAVTDIYGTAHIPSPIPFHWSAARVEYFVRGGSYPEPRFVATITRLSNVREKVMARRIGQVAA